MVTVLRNLVLLAVVFAAAACAALPEQARQGPEFADAACTTEQLVVSSGGAAELRAWILPGETAEPMYSWAVSAGRIVGHGPRVAWEMAGVHPGTYEASVSVRDRESPLGSCTLRVTVLPFLPTFFLLPDRGIVLMPNDSEQDGFGLYTYLIFPRKPNAASRPRYAEAIKTFGRLPQAVAFAEPAPGGEQIAMYLPMRERPSAGGLDNTDWVLDNYDYLRARRMLHGFAQTGNDGPYILTTPVPLDSADAEEAVVNDLSIAPPHLIDPWIKHHVYRAAQEGAWGARLQRLLVLGPRTIIAVLAEGLPEVVAGLDEAVRYVRRWRL